MEYLSPIFSASPYHEGPSGLPTFPEGPNSDCNLSIKPWGGSQAMMKSIRLYHVWVAEFLGVPLL